MAVIAKWALVAVLAVFPIAGLAVSVEQAQKDYAEGLALLQEKNFEGAQKAFAAAAKANPDNKDYSMTALLFNKVIKIRATLDQQKDPNKWFVWAQSLRQVYLLYGINDEALAISQKMHAKYKSPDSATGVAEVLLKMDKNRDTIAVLREIKPKETTPQIQVMLALALARDGKTGEAKKIIAQVPPNPNFSSNVLFQMAQVQALLGNSPRAIFLLSRALENTPPQQIARMKRAAKRANEFASLAGKPEFEKALNTESKFTAASRPSTRPTSKPASTQPAEAKKVQTKKK